MAGLRPGQAALLLLLALAGCGHHRSTARCKAGSPSAEAVGGRFESKGISLAWPGGWKVQASDNYALVLVPAASGPDLPRTISLDVPDLPMHIPGMIPLRLVEKGYLDDLKRQFGRVDTTHRPAPSIPKADVRLVHSSYTAKEASVSETALLLVHADRVYILRATTDPDNYAATHQAYDAVIKSLKWSP